MQQPSGRDTVFNSRQLVTDMLFFFSFFFIHVEESNSVNIFVLMYGLSADIAVLV